MPFKTLTANDTINANRVLVIGPPNSLKTTSILKCDECEVVAPCTHAWPRPLTIMSMPGEKGWQTIPRNVPGITPVVWETNSMEAMAPRAVIREVEEATWKLLATKGVQTLAMDGIHKVYPFYYKKRRAEIADWKLIDDPDLNNQKLDLAAYGNENGGAYAEYMLYLTKVLTSPVPYIVMTVWEGSEPDPDNPKSSHIFADLAGKLARRVTGEFSVTLYSSVSMPDPKGRVKGSWQIRPKGKVWGVGVKVNPDLALKIPDTIPQNFQALEKLLAGSAHAPLSASK
jgi:hypothetical protein